MEVVNHKRPLLLAVRDGRLEEAKVILANINLSDDEKFNFLFYAIFYNQPAVTKYLLENGFERFLKRHRRSKQLYGVAGQNSIQYGTVDIVELLLKYGVDFCNFSADALLEAASKNGNMKFIKSLSFRVKDRDQARLLKKTLTTSTPPDLQPQIFQLLLDHGSSSLNAEEFCAILYLAHSRGNKPAVKSLFNRASSLDLGELLKVAVTKTTGWLPKILQLLLEYGSSDMQIVNDPHIFKHLFEALNKPQPYFLKYHRSCAVILVNHILKLRAAGLYHNKEEFSATVYNDQAAMADFTAQCETEIAAMMKENIGISHITYYDIITRNIEQLARLARNESVLELLKSDSYEVKFPIYKGLIHNQFEKGIVRKELIEKGIKIYRTLIVNFSTLPYDLMEKVVSYSTSKDLRTLIVAFDCSSPSKAFGSPSTSRTRNASPSDDEDDFSDSSDSETEEYSCGCL